MFSTLGTPNEQNWPGVSKLKYMRELSFKAVPGRLREILPPVAITGITLSHHGHHLLTKLLAYDPAQRISAQEALQHPWFQENPKPKPKELMPTFPIQR